MIPSLTILTADLNVCCECLPLSLGMGSSQPVWPYRHRLMRAIIFYFNSIFFLISFLHESMNRDLKQSINPYAVHPLSLRSSSRSPAMYLNWVKREKPKAKVDGLHNEGFEREKLKKSCHRTMCMVGLGIEEGCQKHRPHIKQACRECLSLIYRSEWLLEFICNAENYESLFRRWDGVKQLRKKYINTFEAY